MTEAASHQFSALVAVARRISGMTAAEFDHDLAHGDQTHFANARASFESAARAIVDEDLPRVSMATTREEYAHRYALVADMLAAHRDSINVMVAAARAKSYTGWSVYSSGPIGYAEQP